MASHNFSFEGGEILTGIGASWFVSYAYYQKINKSHQNWNRISTAQTRISKYKSGEEYHKLWLQEILLMNPDNLNKNKIGLNADEIIQMAKELLATY